jgi:hypothetical protein
MKAKFLVENFIPSQRFGLTSQPASQDDDGATRVEKDWHVCDGWLL